MNLFEKQNPINIVSLHVNKQECVEVRANYERIIKHLEGLDYLSEVETEHLRSAKTSLMTLNDCESTIDRNLRKFLS